MLERFVTTFSVQDHAVAEAHDVSWWAAHVALMLVAAGVVTALQRKEPHGVQNHVVGRAVC